MSDLFAGRYAIQHELGQGTFGVVYLTHDVRLRGRPVALKVLHPALSTDPQVVRLFENEAGILAALRHDYIITVYDVGVWELRRYIVMDYVAGPSLAQVVREQGAQPPQRVQAWLRQAAEALAYAHGQGVLHRDVKLANLLLETARDRLFVGDFGLARAAEASGGSSAQSNAQTLTGTAAYRAPEVHRTGHSVASDLYSLGVVGYELLAGRRPFESDDPLSLMVLHATEPVPPLPAGTPAPLAGLVTALLAKDPAQRPASATAAIETLAGSEIAPTPPPQEATPPPADLSPVKPPPPPPVSSTGQPPERPPRRWLGWLAGGVAVVAMLLLAVWALSRPPGVAQLLPTDTPPISSKAQYEEVVITAPQGGSTVSGFVEIIGSALHPDLQRYELYYAVEPDDTWVFIGEAHFQQVTNDLLGTWDTTSLPGGNYGLRLRVVRQDGTYAEGFARNIKIEKSSILTPSGEAEFVEDMVFVPAGDFTMGSPEGQGDGDEHPQHTVYLDAFYIDRTEVTEAQYQRCVEAGACSAADTGDYCTYGAAGKSDHPINCVDWNQAAAFCRWAGKRLPTEAEWEKAARGTDGRVYPWGNSFDGGKVNFCDRNCSYDYKDTTANDGYQTTAPVGSYPAGASPYGALDMAGNVWEWVADWYDSGYYTQSPRQNPQGPASGEYRVLRGGSWNSVTNHVRAAPRYGDPPGNRPDDLGVRCARS